HRAHLDEVRVPSRVVAVQVRVRDEADRGRADLPDRGDDLVGERRVLRVDHEDAVRPGEHANAPAGRVLVARVRAGRSGEQIEVGRDLLGEDLDLRVVDALPLCGDDGRQGRGAGRERERV